MSIPRTRRSRGLLRPTAAGLSTALVATLLQIAVAPTASSLPGLPSAEKPVRGSAYTQVTPRKTNPGNRTPSREPRSVWPRARRASVALPSGKTDAKTLKQAGQLPVSIGEARGKKVRTGAEDAPSSVDVSILSSKRAKRAGTDGMLFTLQAAETKGASSSTHVSVRVNYKAFSEAYGGSYAKRLHLLQMPACALDTDKSDKCADTPPTVVDAVNNADATTLTADSITLNSAQSTLLAVTATAEGDTGTYKASSLSPSSSWDTALNTGDFTWQYPMPTPEVPGGLSPTVV